MLEFPIHTLDSCTGERRSVLSLVAAKYGFVPNLLASLVESPAAARAYLNLGVEVQKSTLTAEERTVAWFAVITANDCHYCMPAHTAGAMAERIEASVLSAARNGAGYASPRLQALHEFVRALINTRGRPSSAIRSAFAGAGFTAEHALECVMIVAQKTLSTYVNALIGTPVDDAFKGFERADTAADDTAVHRALSDA